MYHPDGTPEVTAPPTIFSQCGTALHAVFKDLIYPSIAFKEDDLKPYARKFEVTMQGYYGIAWRAFQIRDKWQKVAAWYKDAIQEKTIRCVLKNGFVLEGTPDLFQVFGNYAVIFDLKTGEAEVDYFPQVELYALILWKLWGAMGLEKVHVALFAPMLEKYESRVYTAEDLAAIEDHYIDNMEAAGVRYMPGPWCRWCKRLTSCPVNIKAIDPLCEDLKGGRELGPADLAHARPAIQVMERIVARYKEVERALVERLGIIDLGNGYELFIKTWQRAGFKSKETLAHLLAEGIPMDAIVERLSFSKEDIKQLARESPKLVLRTQKNGLGATQARILEELENAGAIEEKPQTQISQRRTPDHQIAKEA